MSGMAAEMERRMREDGTSEGGTPASGTGEPPSAEQTPPSAGTSNTDTGSGVPPETIPYARFKEVNDQLSGLKGYQQLAEWGYEPDSLARLAQFEASYVRDPIGTVRAMVDHLDLPDEAKQAIVTQLGTSASGETGEVTPTVGQPPSGANGQEEPPPWAKEILDWKREVQTKDQQVESSALLDKALRHWNELDKADNIESPPDRIQLALIAATSNSGQRFESVEKMVEAARKDTLGYRDTVLGRAVQAGNRTGPPLPVPGGGVPPSTPMGFGSDIKKATAAARAAIERGELPRLT